MFIKKKVIVKLFKRPDSNEIWSLKKRLLWNFLNGKIPTKYVFFKKKVIAKLFKPKDSNKCVYQKKKVIVKLFKRKDSIEICLIKKGYCETF